jgi:hypothetical protein
MAARGVAAAALAVVALTAAACGGGGHKTASQVYAGKLSAACTDMRKQIEALGKPNETPISKIYPGTVRVGHAFVKEIRLLEPPAAEKATAQKMVQQFGYYFDGLAIGYAVLTKRKSQGGFIATVNAAVANERLAVGYAKRLGAPVCARGPFE